MIYPTPAAVLTLVAAAFAALLPACGGASSPSEPTADLGRPAAGFTLPSASGGRVALSDFPGRPVLLYFSIAPGEAALSFFTSYIPYLGALVAGAFALLLALGEGGIPLALGILAFVVLANAVIENLVTPFAVGSSLQLHPLVILVATILGGIVAGFVGIILHR